MEISGISKFSTDRGTVVHAKLASTYFAEVRGGLEIPLEVTIKMTKSVCSEALIGN